jgi:hypothetical protein
LWLWKCRKESKILKEAENNKTRKGDIMTPKPLLQCTRHLCPVRVHWHIKDNYKDYWRVKIAIINFNYRMNYTQWGLVVQHPNLNNVTQVYSFEYMPLLPYQAISKSFKFRTMCLNWMQKELHASRCQHIYSESWLTFNIECSIFQIFDTEFEIWIVWS